MTSNERQHRGRHPGQGSGTGTGTQIRGTRDSGTQLGGTVPGTEEFRDSVPGTENFPGHGLGPVPTPVIYRLLKLPLGSKKAERFEKLLGFGRSQSIVHVVSDSLMRHHNTLFLLFKVLTV